jgi:CO dehydrogenase maturation factor
MGFETARRIKELIKEVHIDVKQVYLVGNSFTNRMREALEKAADDVGLELAGMIPIDENVMNFNMMGKSLLDIPNNSPAYIAVEEIANRIGLNDLKEA